jgi:hypothetical protein
MDYERFDNDECDDDEEYFEFVRWLSSRAAAELRDAKEDPVQQRQALCRYYKRGFRAHLTPGELIDFLGVSSPSILDMAGYSDEEGGAMMAISDGLTEEEIRRTALV